MDGRVGSCEKGLDLIVLGRQDFRLRPRLSEDGWRMDARKAYVLFEDRTAGCFGVRLTCLCQGFGS